MMWKVHGGGREIRTVVRDGTVTRFMSFPRKRGNEHSIVPELGLHEGERRSDCRGSCPDGVRTAVLQHFVTRTCGVVFVLKRCWSSYFDN